MICAACKEQGLKSTISGGGTVSTAMGFSPFFDAEGIFHLHDPNTRTETWRCSNGHLTIVEIRRSCPNSLVCGYVGSREERVS